jgi:hypothetical protein
MADKKISALTSATTPLAGTEVLPIVQGGATVKVTVADLTAGRNVGMADLTTTGNTILGNATADTVNMGNGDVIKNGSGNLLIGYATDQGSGKLQVNGAGRIGAIDFNTDDITYVGGGNFQIGSVFGTPLLFKTSGTECARFDSSGGFILVGSTAQKATGTTWSNPSDQRLKNNIRDYAKGTAELMQVRVREWEYNGKGGTIEGTKGLGVIADEAMLVLPDTVGTYQAKLNADDEQATDIKNFDATEITWLLVKTVQEQQDLIQALTARVTALETN